MNAVDPLIIHRMAMSLRGALPAHGHHVVLITSTRAGEGKTTVAGLLARALAAQGPDEVLLIDGGNGVGKDGPVTSGIERLLEGAELRPDLLRADRGGRLHRLGHGLQFRSTQWFQPGRVAGMLTQCRERFALPLVDAPALPGCGALLAEADRVVRVVDATRTPGPAVRAALAEAGLVAPRLAGLVLNRQSAPMPRWLGG